MKSKIKLYVQGANQTVVYIGDNALFFSYSTLVAVYVDGHYYRTGEFYSSTTSRHINKFLAGINEATVVSQEELEGLLGV